MISRLAELDGRAIQGQHRRSDGQVLWVQLRASALSLNGIALLHVLVIDSSEQERLETALGQRELVFVIIVLFALLGQGLSIVVLVRRRRLLSRLSKELRTKQQNLEATEKRFFALFDAMTEMVVLHEVVRGPEGKIIDYRIVACNPSFSRITGLSQGTVLGKLASEVYGSNPPPYLEEFGSVVESGRAFAFSTYYTAMTKFFQISVVSYAPECFATITTDVTDLQKKSAQLEQKNKELESYLYLASHDLRSLLVNVQGFASRIAEDLMGLDEKLAQLGLASDSDLFLNLTQRIPRSLSYIHSGVQKIEALLRGLSAVSKTGTIVLHPSVLNMRTLVDEVLKTHRFAIEKTRAQLELRDLPDCFADYTSIQQLFGNIISNALKYHKQNEAPQVLIEGWVEGANVVYRVSDKGRGIAPEHREKVWELFFREHPSGAEPGEGIGLSIVAKIAERNGGKVWLESELGEGTQFYVQLPHA